MVMEYKSDEEIQEEQGVDPNTGNVISFAPGGSQGGPPIQNISPRSADTGSSGFTSITQYLEQNKPQSQKLAGQVGQFVTDKGDEARSALEQGQEQFDESSQAVEFDKDLVSSAFDDPSQFVESEEDVERFNVMQDASYEGPSSFEEGDYFTGITDSITDAQRAGEGTRTEEGQRALLTEMAPSATPGMTSLDQLLLSNPKARGTLAESREGLSDLDQRLLDASEAAKVRAEQSRATTGATAQSMDEAIRGAYGGFESGINEQTQAAREKAFANIAGYENLFTGPNPQVASSLFGGQIGGAPRPDFTPSYEGLTPEHLNMSMEALQDIINKNNALPVQHRVDLGQYFSSLSPEAQITRANVATPEQYAQLAALNQLSGNPDMYGASQGFLPEEYGGAYNPDMVDFDLEGAMADMMSKYRQSYTKPDRVLYAGGGGDVTPSPGFSGQSLSYWEGVDPEGSAW